VQTIQLNVNSNHVDFLLSMLQNLKDGIIENIIIDKPIANTSVGDSTIRLTPKDTELFLEALDKPPQIYPRLKEAFKEYENSQIKL
jgi:uncharacterized protein (DUF1778 family)